MTDQEDAVFMLATKVQILTLSKERQIEHRMLLAMKQLSYMESTVQMNN